MFRKYAGRKNCSKSERADVEHTDTGAQRRSQLLAESLFTVIHEKWIEEFPVKDISVRSFQHFQEAP